jgi:hypothetical protein
MLPSRVVVASFRSLLNFNALHNLAAFYIQGTLTPVNAFRWRQSLAYSSKSGATVMPGDPEESRMLASRCAEIAATATTPQLKAWFSDLSIRWEKLAIELEKDFAKFIENDATRDARRALLPRNRPR